jgi:predicted permease
MNNLIRDLRYAFRQLKKNPGFTIVAMLTLALGIGAPTTIFTLLNAIMLRSAPVQDPNHLVVLQWTARRQPNGDYSSFGDCAAEAGGGKPYGCSFSYSAFKEIRTANIFEGVGAFAGSAELTLTGNGTASIARAELVSGDYFETLGLKAALGRTMQPADEVPGAAPVAVLSYAYWTNAFGASPSVIGKTIHLNSAPFTIVGIADPRFTRLTPGKTQDMWVPLTSTVQLGIFWDGHDSSTNKSRWWLTIIGRLKPGASVKQAQAGVSLLFRNETLYGAEPVFKDADQPTVNLLPVQKGLTGIREKLGQPLYILMAIVGILLLITCANIAGLILARATTREREMAVRFALGAARGRIVRQLLTESILLSVIGAVLGIILASWGSHSLAVFLASWRSSLELNVRPDANVLIFTTAIAILAGIGFGILPAFRSSGVDVVPALKESSGSATTITALRGRFRLGDSLVVSQMALSVLVLVIASLLVHTLINLKNINPGFDMHQTLLFSINPVSAGYKDPQIRALYQELQARLSSLPGVTSVSYSSDALIIGDLWSEGVRIEGQDNKAKISSQMLAVGPGFFATMRIPFFSGREFLQSDLTPTPSVAIINEAFAKKFFPGRNPLGLHITREDDKNIASEIVGVVGDTKYAGLRDAVKPTAYIPINGDVGHEAYFELRTNSNPTTLIPAVRRVLSDIDNNVPILNIATQSEMTDRLIFNERMVALLSTLFASLALVLVCIGLYGLLSYEVSKRTREIGIRTALGAHRGDVIRLVVGQGIMLAFIGTGIGIAAAIGGTRYLQSMLYGVRPNDPMTLAASGLLLIVVGLLACYVPARRAAKVDPMVALRYE